MFGNSWLRHAQSQYHLTHGVLAAIGQYGYHVAAPGLGNRVEDVSRGCSPRHVETLYSDIGICQDFGIGNAAWAGRLQPKDNFSDRRGLTNHNPLVMVSGMPSNADRLFKALADPTRRAIFERLTRDGAQTVHALTECAGVSQPMVSKHLSALRRASLVRNRRKGRETHYSAQPQALAPLVDWMHDYSRFWHDRLDQLEDLLKRMDP